MINKLLPGLRKNILLKNYTTFHIGGPAKYFYTAKNKNDLIKAVKAAKELKLPFFVLGGGSNVLVADDGYDGLVIKFQSSNYKFQTNSKIQNAKIYIESGMPLSLLVSKTAEKGLTGLEWAVGIPGTVGGAIRGNAGAFEQSMNNIVKKVEVLSIREAIPALRDGFPQEIKTFRNKD